MTQHERRSRPIPPAPIVTEAQPGPVEAVLRPDLAWEQEYTIRATRYRDTYTRLTTAGWRPGDPVAVLQMDRRSLAGVPGPAEGSFSRGVPGWLVSAMRQSGMALTDDPLVLTRAVLNGVVPEPDGVGAVLSVAFGGPPP